MSELQAIREQIRSGKYSGPTSGLAPGYVQANVVILPAQYAQDFTTFCLRNPQPCPLLAVSDVGNPNLPTLGDIDIRSDVSAYRIFEDGQETAVATDITDLWQDDFVAFALGCSFSFEEALMEAGLPIRHYDTGKPNPVYISNVPTHPAGPFSGPMVVSMRPYSVKDTIRAIQITSRFPHTHGAPIHFGDPHAIGIDNLSEPDFDASPVPIYDGEIPVFWACGITPQMAIQQAKIPFCITHKPACMLITEIRNSELSTF